MRSANGQLGENERQWKNSEQEHKQQNFLWAHTTFFHKTCNLEVSRWDNEGKEMYKKVCCTSKVVFLLIKPNVFFCLSHYRRRLALHDFMFRLCKLQVR